jgi:dihydropteroate synthase
VSQPGNATQSWRVDAGRELPLDRPRIIGILNVTPDSFSDGGSYADFKQAADAALAMHRDGARIIDIGGESTRPGSTAVDSSEQVRRTLPVIKELRRHLNSDKVLISIDTTQSEVAQAALDGGADLINDISAGLDDARMLPLAASRQCGLILMHRRVASAADTFSHQYEYEPDYGGDVVLAVRQFLAQRAHEACQAGVHPQSIVIDPGLGFGKSVRQNYELAGRIHELAELKYHVLSAASRKSFIGSVSAERNPPRRVAGSIAMSIAHWFMGVRLFRVHDVLPQWQALNVAAAVMNPEMVPQQIAPPTAIPPACYHA